MIRAQQLGHLPNLAGMQARQLNPLQTGQLTATQTSSIDINSITNLMLVMMVMVMMMKMMNNVTETMK